MLNYMRCNYFGVTAVVDEEYEHNVKKKEKLRNSGELDCSFSRYYCFCESHSHHYYSKAISI